MTTAHTGSAPIAKFRLLLAAIRFEHSVFALPFAYLGMVLASDGLPTWWQFVWITIAMVAARTLAMSANRLIDVEHDTLNPRTAARALPTGLLKRGEMLAMALVSLALFLAAAAMLNTLALALAPVAAVVVVGYSYVKRFSWLTHFALGAADAIAPAGGWIAVSGTLPWEAVLLSFGVAMWIGGFDIFYACQDIDFDKKHGVHSIPKRFGTVGGFWVARGMHLLTSMALLGVGLLLGLTWPYYVGWAIASALLVYEHWIISPRDLSRLNAAFFSVNGYIAVIVFGFAFLSLYV
ncbi:MAG: putative 4-hydroxybenzoate polyprenyltransferase [Chloroflexi bacterium]|nr:putative 4-hydroxybenzoate polyprenyltransferase [Chloroflexota bacterium]